MYKNGISHSYTIFIDLTNPIYPLAIGDRTPTISQSWDTCIIVFY